MSLTSRATHAMVRRSAFAAAFTLLLPLGVAAQETPASTSSAPGMAMDSMPGMPQDDMPGMKRSTTTPAAADTGRQITPHATVVIPAGGKHTATPAAPPTPGGLGGMDGKAMGAMQGGSAPPGARSPDYSDGVGYGSRMPQMSGNDAVGMLSFDQLEAKQGHDGNAQAWEIEGSYGRDLDKLWVRTEGDVSAGKIQEGDAEAFWYHGISTYWGRQLGVRHDFGVGPQRNWAAFGVEGIAPYFFKVQATGYVGSQGRTAARFRADYEVLFTQRLILQPELEANLYGKDDPQRRIGSGLSDIQFGLRLRYEIKRQFAPYIGINFVDRIGTTADFARQDHQHVFDRQIVAGVRVWF